MSDAIVKLILFDIRKEINDVVSFINGMDEDQFVADIKTQKAVTMSLQVIGESAKKLPEAFTKRYKDIEWNKIVGLRNRISHDYAGLDMALIWQIVTIELPVFKKQIHKIKLK